MHNNSILSEILCLRRGLCIPAKVSDKLSCGIGAQSVLEELAPRVAVAMIVTCSSTVSNQLRCVKHEGETSGSIFFHMIF